MYAAPQAGLLSTLIKTVMSGDMPWGLILLGAGIALIAELSGFIGLSIAAGMYWPISTVMPIFAGALIRYLVTPKEEKNKKEKKATADAEFSPGMLYATGLVAGCSLIGMILGFLGGFFPAWSKILDLGHHYWKFVMPKDRSNWSDYLAFVPFLGLALFLYQSAKKKREASS